MNKFQLGQNILANKNSTIKAGTRGEIIDVFQQGRFWKYQIRWENQENFITIAREKDLTLVE